jgi:hypothetical protein
MTTTYTKWPQPIPNDRNKYQMTTTYTKWPQQIPNDRNISQGTRKLENDSTVEVIFKLISTYLLWMWLRGNKKPGAQKIFLMPTRLPKQKLATVTNTYVCTKACSRSDFVKKIPQNVAQHVFLSKFHVTFSVKEPLSK